MGFPGTGYKVKLTFTENVLGTVPLDEEIYESYIATKKAKAAESNGVGLTEEEVEEELGSIDEDKGKTGFHTMDDGTPFLYDYVIRGFFKSAAGMLRRVSGTKSSKITAYKKIIDGLVFVDQRKIPFTLSGDMSVLQRPLRASTPQGERVALAYSDTIPEASTIEFGLTILDDKTITQEVLEEWFTYGRYMGIGQWRSGGWGRFVYEIEKV